VLDTVGRDGLNTWPVVLAAAPVLIPRAAPFYCSAGYTCKNRRRLGSPVAPTRCAARATPVRMPPPQACPRRRAGVAYDERTTAAVGKPYSRHHRRQDHVSACEPACHEHRSRLAEPSLLGQF